MPLSRISRVAFATAALLTLPSMVVADETLSTVEEDAALAEQVLERHRKASEIASWAWNRAKLAIRNSPTVVAKQEELDEKVATCLDGLDGIHEDSKKFMMAQCNRIADNLDDDELLKLYEDELKELSELLILKRLRKEREQMEKDQFDALRRRLGVADGSII